MHVEFGSFSSSFAYKLSYRCTRHPRTSNHERYAAAEFDFIWQISTLLPIGSFIIIANVSHCFRRIIYNIIELLVPAALHQ